VTADLSIGPSIVAHRATPQLVTASSHVTSEIASGSKLGIDTMKKLLREDFKRA
jgi:hypothetical protein